MSAEIIAGRRATQGVDQGISGSEADGIASTLGINRSGSNRTGRELKGDVGRYVRRGPNKDIYIDQSLPADTADRVMMHELGHGLDDMAYQIPVTGIKRELGRVYEDLNTSGWFKPGRGATPKARGYKGDDADAELMAEAIRAYMVDPNYLKTVAPKTAKRIRQYLNVNPRVNKAIQFNTAAPATVGGLLGMSAYQASE